MSRRPLFELRVSPLRQTLARAALAALLPLVATLQPWATGGEDTARAGASTPIAQTTAPPAPSAPIEPALALATFDAAWQHVADSDYDFSQTRVDWPAVREEMRPRVRQVGTRSELLELLQDMLDRIGESHFTVIPEAAMQWQDDSPERSGAPGTSGLTVRLLEDRALVTAVAADSAAAKAGVRPGWWIDSVDGRSVADAVAAANEAATDAARRRARVSLEAQLQHRLANQPVGAALTLQLREPSGRSRSVAIEGLPMPGRSINVPMLPPMQLDFSHRAHPLPGGGCVGEIAFSVWVVDVNALLADAMAELDQCHGILLDLRGNPGGIMAVMMSVAGFFVDQPTTLGTLRTRDATLHFRAQPRRVTNEGVLVEPMTGPVAILVDSQSMSTSEMFASGMQSVGRARIFGSTTPGMALPSRMVGLPSGDVLMHAFAEYTDPDGRRIEGDGVTPDQPTPSDPASLLAGRDATRDAAIGWIQENGPVAR